MYSVNSSIRSHFLFLSNLVKFVSRVIGHNFSPMRLVRIQERVFGRRSNDFSFYRLCMVFSRIMSVLLQLLNKSVKLHIHMHAKDLITKNTFITVCT